MTNILVVGSIILTNLVLQKMLQVVGVLVWNVRHMAELFNAIASLPRDPPNKRADTTNFGNVRIIIDIVVNRSIRLPFSNSRGERLYPSICPRTVLISGRSLRIRQNNL
jgi:hypothetical protein